MIQVDYLRPPIGQLEEYRWRMFDYIRKANLKQILDGSQGKLV